MVSAKVNPALVYGTGVIQPGIVPAMRRAGLAGGTTLGFDPTSFVTGQLPGMSVPAQSSTPSQAIRVLVTRGNNWRGRY